MLFGTFFLLLALGWSAMVADAVYESAQNGGGTIVMFDRVMGEPGLPDGIWFLCVLSASAGLAVAVALGILRGRRLERRMTAELDERVDARSQREAGDAARAQLLQHRLIELQNAVDELIVKRDAAYEDMRAHVRRVQELDELAHEQREALAKLATSTDPDVVAIPEIPDDVDDELAGQAEDDVLKVEEPVTDGS